MLDVLVDRHIEYIFLDRHIEVIITLRSPC